MRSRGLSFADAVKLLDGDSEMVERLGRIAGVGAGAVTVASVGTVDFFALRDEVVRWGHGAVRTWRDRVRGLSRFDRTDRLVAAHSVIVLVSFYEALAGWLAARGIDLAEAELTAADQAALATGGPAAGNYAAMVRGLVEDAPPYPVPDRPGEKLEVDLRRYYAELALDVTRFLGGLEAFHRLNADISDLVDHVSYRALKLYVAYFRRLVGEIPEFRLWSEMVDARATRELVREAIGELRAGHAPVDAVLSGLTKRYGAQLDKPILSSADAPGDLVLPTLRRGYLEPAGMVARAHTDSLPATEAWWSRRGRTVADVPDFLFAHLTAPAATDRPLLVLGHPGSGKSVLTRMLSTRLADAGFLPIRVELRNVRADSPIQRQIEETLYLFLGETVSWPELARRAAPALPVVMMDGFDELLQATGQNWADYLEQLQDFQQREAELGRPLAVVVTSRTVVADRARLPNDTTVVRLSPFTDEQVGAWLRVWNDLNAGGLAGRGLRPLPVDVALGHRELAQQPLLLLLLALYDGRANALQGQDGGLGRVELYERLFTDFFERQVDKFGTRLSPEQWDAEVEAEWRRLSAVAVAMHNRGKDVIRESELEADARFLLRDEDRTLPDEAKDRPLTVAQLLVGRFFFVHESRASRDTTTVERSFEFLHATFGEFLTARQLVLALVDLAEERAAMRRRPGATLDAGFLHALTSFATVTRRAPLWEFCQGLIARLDDAARRRCRDLVLELLRGAGHPHPTWSLAAYEPERRTVSQRHAAFAANLIALAVLLHGEPVDAVDLVGEPVVLAWRRQALLCMSQLEPEDARRLWQALRVEWRLAEEPVRLTVRLEDGSPVGLIASLPWPPEDHPRYDGASRDLRVAAEAATGRMIRKSAFVQTGIDARELFYAVAPFWQRFGDLGYLGDVPLDPVTAMTTTPNTRDSDLSALLGLLLAADVDADVYAGADAELAMLLRSASPEVFDFLVRIANHRIDHGTLGRILDLAAGKAIHMGGE